MLVYDDEEEDKEVFNHLNDPDQAQHDIDQKENYYVSDGWSENRNIARYETSCSGRDKPKRRITNTDNETDVVLAQSDLTFHPRQHKSQQRTFQPSNKELGQKLFRDARVKKVIRQESDE